MISFKNLTIGEKILAGYCLVLGLMLFLGIFSLIEINSLSGAAETSGSSPAFVAALVILAALASGAVVAYISWRDIKKIMGKVAEGIELNARTIAMAAGDLTTISRSLSNSASRQAATVEETSAALEEMTATSRETASLTAGSEVLMNENIEKSGQSLKALIELTRNMSRIEEESDQIRKIIATIDSIAFQTNLLALNAAVEAARAGAAGAGFAVVADEVKNLAGRAAEAAKTTQTLLDNTINQVTASAEALKQVNQDFDSIVTSSTSIGDKTTAITEASRQQSKGIEEIAKASLEMDQVTQNLSSEAENSARAAGDLTGQAEEMGVMVAHLMRMVFGNKRKAEAITATRSDVTCWEMKNCPSERRDICPAYPNQGSTCWTVTGTQCGGKEQGSYHEKIANCRKCNVFEAAHDNGGARASKANSVHCWEVLNCPDERRDICPAYPTQGDSCWMVTGTQCGGKEQGSYHEKIANCRKCNVYQMVHQDVNSGKTAPQIPMIQ